MICDSIPLKQTESLEAPVEELMAHLKKIRLLLLPKIRECLQPAYPQVDASMQKEYILLRFGVDDRFLVESF